MIFCNQATIRTLIAVVSSLLLIKSAFASDEVFSSHRTIEYQDTSATLALSGETMRTKFVFDVYKVAHYMDWPDNVSAAALSEEKALDLVLSGNHLQQIDIIFQRDLRANQIIKALVGGIKSNCLADEFNSIQNPLHDFKQAVSVDIDAQTQFTLRWLPSGTVEGFFEGESVMRIDDPLFAKLLWSVWFGDNAVIDTRELLANRVSI